MIKFKNISLYVHREIDYILRKFKEFCRIYIDDIVIFSRTLNKHIEHFYKIFNLFNRFYINLSSTKSFFEHFTIQLLNFKVNVFDLFTIKEKLKAIINLKFLKTLQDLKIYFEFTNWLREYILYYMQKSKSLQTKKTTMLRLSSNHKKRFRKIFSQTKFIEDFTSSKLNSYKQIQETFFRSFFLIHFDYIRFLYADINVSKKWDFETMIYHDKTDDVYLSDDFSKKSSIQSIFIKSSINKFEK